MATKTIKTSCCIAGGGPAGMMLGFLLARAGVRVIVLEKHDDFLRDFRGDTVHPSTLELMHELGLLEDFLKLAASKSITSACRSATDTVKIALADYRRCATTSPSCRNGTSSTSLPSTARNMRASTCA